LWPVGLFLVARLALSGLGIALWQLGTVPTQPDPIARPYFGVEPVVHGLSGMLLGVWQRHDTIHYLRIAAGGYSSPDLTAYYPLFPLLVRLVGILVGGNYLLASLIVSNAAALLAIAVCYRLFCDELGEDAARRATAYLVFFPPPSFCSLRTASRWRFCSLYSSFGAHAAADGALLPWRPSSVLSFVSRAWRSPSLF
jgi:hypothetical protein